MCHRHALHRAADRVEVEEIADDRLDAQHTKRFGSRIVLVDEAAHSAALLAQLPGSRAARRPRDEIDWFAHGHHTCPCWSSRLDESGRWPARAYGHRTCIPAGYPTCGNMAESPPLFVDVGVYACLHMCRYTYVNPRWVGMAGNGRLERAGDRFAHTGADPICE